MKKPLLTLALAALSLGAFAQTPAAAPAAGPTPTSSAEPLGSIINQVMHTENTAELLALAAELERTAAAAPADWLPRYYQAYALIISVFQSKEKSGVKDRTLDQGEAALARARQLGGDESELLTLQAYAYQARLSVSPVRRGFKYSRLIASTVAQAKALNQQNPRAYLIGADDVYYTPAMFGGGPAAAHPLFEAAKTKFAAFHPASPLAPNWGEDYLLTRLRSYDPAAPAK